MSVARMQALDDAAIQTLGITRLLLMDHAGLALSRAVALLAPQGMVLVCCGGGYNGGDGLAAARHLEAAGYPVCVLLMADRASLRAEPAVFAGIAERLGLPLACCPKPEALAAHAARFQDAAVIVDALLGIGFRGSVHEPMVSAIDAINRAGKPVVSADVPSGLDADSGAVESVAVTATITVTFGLPKRGCAQGQGIAHSGRVLIEPITFPRGLLEQTRRMP